MGVLLERGEFLNSLGACAEQARSGAGQLALIAGEAGAGKSALLEAFRSRLVNARWLWGACEGTFTPRPLGPIFDVAYQLGGPLTDPGRSAGREELARMLLDELAVSSVLTVVVIEDLHWADEATLDILRFLSRRLRESQTLLVATYRNDGLSREHPLRLAVGELLSDRATTCLTLPPLSEHGVRQLARGSSIGAAELFELTGGNPFYVTEVIAAGDGSVPLTASEAVLARAARLSPAARRVLDAAAVLGTRADLEILRALGCDDADAIDECLTTGVLISDPDGLRFRHELSRLSVEAAVPAHRRMVLHAKALDHLRDRLEDDARLAHHADGAGDGAATLHYARLAAMRASELAAHRESAAQWERAARYAAPLPEIERAELYEALGAELALVDRWDDAVAAMENALDLWLELGDGLRAGAAQAALARTFRVSRVDRAGALADAAISTLEKLPPSGALASAYASKAWLLMYADPVQSLSLSKKAQEVARTVDDQAMLSDALIAEALARGGLGESGEEQLHAALEVALAARSDGAAARAYDYLQLMYQTSMRFAEAERIYEEGLAYSEEHDAKVFSTCLHAAQAALLLATGRWAEAARLSSSFLERTDMSPGNRVMFAMVLATIRIRRGEFDASADLIELVCASAASMNEQVWIQSTILRAEAAWLNGRPEDARAALAEFSDVAVRYPDPWLRGQYAWWMRRVGLDDSVVTEVARPHELARAGAWAEAAAAWDELGCPYEAAVTLVDSGDDAAMREAISLLDGLGATAAVRIAQARMRSLGSRAIPRGPRRATKEDPFGLTKREREVLELICLGLTDGKVAERLFISERTVHHHVSSVLTKMDVGSRREAAEKAKNLQLSPQT